MAVLEAQQQPRRARQMLLCPPYYLATHPHGPPSSVYASLAALYTLPTGPSLLPIYPPSPPYTIYHCTDVRASPIRYYTPYSLNALISPPYN